MAVPQPQGRITVDEYERMIAHGVLTEDDRVELIAGEIVEMAARGIAHINTVNYLNDLLTGIPEIRQVAIMSVQNPIRLPVDWEPEPDVTLLRRTRYRAVPGAEDVLLVIEVADSTRFLDRNTKLPRYARAGIAEAWLFDLTARHIERHTDPRPDGYHETVPASRGESLTSTVLSALTLVTDEIMRAADGT